MLSEAKHPRKAPPRHAALGSLMKSLDCASAPSRDGILRFAQNDIVETDFEANASTSLLLRMNPQNIYCTSFRDTTLGCW
jgi:hypothetical protein